MKRRGGYFRLGLFIVGAVGTGVAILLLIGIGNLFRPTAVLETYFDGSVQGLDVGAPVKLRGVPIGEVSHIGFTHAAYEQDVPPMERRQYVMVEAVLRVDRLSASGRLPTPEMVQGMVDRGLRVRMTPQGVTGINFLELDFLDPALHVPIPIDWTPENIYVPSAPGTVTQFIEYADRIARRLDQLEVEDMVDNLNRLLTRLDTVVGAVDVDRINEEIVTLLSQFRGAAVRLDHLLASPGLEGVPENLAAAVENLRALTESPRVDRSLDALDRAMTNLERAAGGIEQTVHAYEHDLAQILDNLRAMSDQLRALSDEAAMYPGVFLGSPPAPPEVPEP